MILSELAEHIQGTVEGDGTVDILSVAFLDDAGPQDIAFLSDVAYASRVPLTKAAAVLVNADYDAKGPHSLVRVRDVGVALDWCLHFFSPEPDRPPVGVHPTAVVAKSAKLGQDVAIGALTVVGDGVVIGDRTVIGPSCVLGREITIGKDCELRPQVVIEQHCILKDNVIILSGAKIGNDGFGYTTLDGQHLKIPHIGRVIIEEHVEIGANSCVDRAKCGDTVIHRGSKIDNLVQIAHNVQLGEHNILCAQVGIAGSTSTGKYVVMGGQSGAIDHIHVPDFLQAACQSAITKEFPPGTKVAGFPARETVAYYREQTNLKRLKKLIEEVKSLKADLAREKKPK